MRKPGESIGRARIRDVIPEGDFTLVILESETMLVPIEPGTEEAQAIIGAIAPRKKTAGERAAYKPKHSRPIGRIATINGYDHL